MPLKKKQSSKERILPLPQKPKTIVKAQDLIFGLEALQEIGSVRIEASRAIAVALALKSVQTARDAAIEALKAASEEDKAKVLESQVELPFGPFMIEGLLAGGTISPVALMKLDGWFICLPSGNE